MEKIKVWEKEIKSLITEIAGCMNLSSWKFKQNIKNVEKISINDLFLKLEIKPYSLTTLKLKLKGC